MAPSPPPRRPHFLSSYQTTKTEGRHNRRPSSSGLPLHLRRPPPSPPFTLATPRSGASCSSPTTAMSFRCSWRRCGWHTTRSRRARTRICFEKLCRRLKGGWATGMGLTRFWSEAVERRAEPRKEKLEKILRGSSNLEQQKRPWISIARVF